MDNNQQNGEYKQSSNLIKYPISSCVTALLSILVNKFITDETGKEIIFPVLAFLPYGLDWGIKQFLLWYYKKQIEKNTANFINKTDVMLKNGNISQNTIEEIKRIREDVYLNMFKNDSAEISDMLQKHRALNENEL